MTDGAKAPPCLVCGEKSEGLFIGPTLPCGHRFVVPGCSACKEQIEKLVKYEAAETWHDHNRRQLQ